MRTTGFPRRFVYERWVEGPIEGMEDLSKGIDKEKEGMKAVMGISAFILISFIIMLVISLVLDIGKLLSSSAEPSFHLSSAMLSLLFLFMALAASTLAIQVLSFMTTALMRFENVDDLFSKSDVDISDALEDLKDHKDLDEFNLFGATSKFTNGVTQNLPHASKRITYVRAVFFLVPIYFWARILLLPMLFDLKITLFSGILESIFSVYVIIMSIMSMVSGVMIVEVVRLMQVILARMNFLDRIKSARPADHAGSSQDRLKQFLKDSDGCYGMADMASEEFFLQHASDECLVLAITTQTPPAIDMVKEFYSDCKEFVESRSFVPSKGRFIILYTPEGAGDEISDTVTQFILKNPIVLGQGHGDARSETVIQIIIEEGGTYNFFPFVC